MPTLHERLEGGLFGLLIGDALGVPYEFHPPQALPPLAEIEMAPPAAFARAHVGVPPGTWSDDGAQALALLASLLDQGKLDVQDLRLHGGGSQGVRCRHPDQPIAAAADGGNTSRPGRPNR
jgi:ADP-ribosylglycohydrolase